MNDFQREACDEIKRIAEAAKLKVNFVWSYANVGRAWLRDGAVTVANIQLNFQDDHLVAAIARGGDKAEFFGHNDSIHYAEYGADKKWNWFYANVAMATKRRKRA